MKQLIDIFNKKPVLISLLGLFALMLINHLFFFSGYFGFDDIVYSQLSTDIVKGNYSLMNEPFAYRWTTIFPTALAYIIFGNSDFSRAIFPIITSVSIILISLIFIKEKTYKVKLIAILLTISSYWFFYYSDKIMADIYVAFSFISVFAIIYYYKFYKSQQTLKFAILLSFSLIFGFISKGTIILILPIIGVVFINDIIKKENLKFWTVTVLSSILLLTAYFVIIKIATGTYLMRFYLIESNSYFNQCSYDQLPAINTIKRISYQLITNFIETGLFVPIVFGLSLLTKDRIKNIFNTSRKSSYILLITIFAVLSANFMTISATAYVPMCVDIRHYLFLIPILSVGGSIGLYYFVESKNINLFIPLSFTVLAIFSAFAGYSYYLYFLFGLASISIVLFKTKNKISLIIFVILMLLTPIKIIKSGYDAKWNEHKTEIQNIIDTKNNIAIITNDAEKQIINMYSDFDTLNIKTFNFREIEKINFKNYTKIYWVSYWLTEYYTGLDYFKLPLIIRDNDSTLNYYYNSKSLQIVNQPKPIIFFNNFENKIGNWNNNKNIVEPQGFSTTLEESFNKINLDSLNKFVRLSVKYKSKDTSSAQLVFTIDANGKNILWKSTKLSEHYQINKEWNKAILETKLPNIENSTLKAYVWNTNSDSLLIDNFKLIIF